MTGEGRKKGGKEVGDKKGKRERKNENEWELISFFTLVYYLA